MNPSLIHDFVLLIASRTGIQVQDKDRTELVKKINLRITALKINTPEAYYQLLATPSGEQEWQALALLLTTGETYFFRDRGQINLIQQTILPEIIARKQLAIAPTKPTLRIWSAGCSTGEEPYSIATIVKELIPNYSSWNLLILGTDINTESIAKAKTASFSEWSFRMVDPDLKRKYFRNQDKSWQLNEEVRKMVTLQTGNLLADDYPSLNSNIYNMDMIICRNVFIYFNSDNVETILEKLYQTLSPGGYLIVGHTELHDLNLKGFVAQAYDESVVYQRSEDVQQVSSRPTKLQATIPIPKSITTHQANLPINLKQTSVGTKSSVKPLAKPVVKLENPDIKRSDRQIPISDLDANLQKTQTLFEQGEYTQTLQQAAQLLQHHPDNFALIYLIAQTHANLGEYQKAIYYCQQAIALDSMSIDIYHLLSHISEAQNNLNQAKNYLKRIIYIDETAIAAYLDLGNIYKIEGDDRRAQKMFNHATKLLQELSTDTIQYRGEVAVSELLEQLNPSL